MYYLQFIITVKCVDEFSQAKNHTLTCEITLLEAEQLLWETVVPAVTIVWWIFISLL